MKKVLSLLFASTLLLVSCGDDDSDNNSGSVDTSLIVGTWNFDDMDVDVDTSVTGMGQDITTSSNTTIVSSTTTVTFNEDGTYTTDGEYTMEINATGLGVQTQTVDMTGGSGNYVINGNEIIVTGQFVPSLGSTTLVDLDVTTTITTLTANDFVIEIEGDNSFDFQGITTEAQVDGVQVLSR